MARVIEKGNDPFTLKGKYFILLTVVVLMGSQPPLSGKASPAPFSVSLHKSLLSGPALLAELKVTTLPVRLLGALFPLTVEQAIAVCQTGVYEGKVRRGRVYWIREADSRMPPLSQPEYWKDRAVIKYWGDQSYRDETPLRLGKNLWLPALATSPQNP